MPATSRLLCDAVVVKVAAFWSPAAPNAVERVYLPDTDDPHTIVGRRVFVFPASEVQVAAATRALDTNEFRLGVLTLENFKDAGEPTRDWVDARVDFVADLKALLGDARTTAAAPLFPAPFADVYPETADTLIVYDPDELRENKLFWSLMEIAYRRDE